MSKLHGMLSVTVSRCLFSCLDINSCMTGKEEASTKTQCARINRAVVDKYLNPVHNDRQAPPAILSLGNL